MRTVEESYHRGITVRVEENNEVNRLCVFIQGLPNVGKTYAAKHALNEKRIITIEGGGTGKFDRLKASTEAIIISDDVSPNLLNMTDNYMCQAYRRQSQNPFWCGSYFIVTSNLSFEDWLQQCGIKENHFTAMRSRFFICHIEKNCGRNILLCDSISSRGNTQEQLERRERFMEFSNRYNKILSSYVPDQIEVDYSSITFWKELKEIAEMEYQEHCRFIEEENHFATQEIYAEIEVEQRRQLELQRQTAVQATPKSLPVQDENLDRKAEQLRLNGYILESPKSMPGLYYETRK